MKMERIKKMEKNFGSGKNAAWMQFGIEIFIRYSVWLSITHCPLPSLIRCQHEHKHKQTNDFTEKYFYKFTALTHQIITLWNVSPNCMLFLLFFSRNGMYFSLLQDLMYVLYHPELICEQQIFYFDNDSCSRHKSTWNCGPSMSGRSKIKENRKISEFCST